MNVCKLGFIYTYNIYYTYKYVYTYITYHICPLRPNYNRLEELDV